MSLSSVRRRLWQEGLLKFFDLIGEEGVGLWMIDQEVGKLEAYAARVSGKFDA